MKKSAKILFALILILPLAFIGCGSNLSGKAHSSLAYFSTESRTVIYDDFSESANVDKFSACWEEIEKTIAEIERSVSVSVENSYISAFNEADAGEKVEVDKITFDILCISLQYYQETNGAFNPATGLLVDLWGFSPRFFASDYTPVKKYDRAVPSKELPETKYIEAFKTLTDFGKVTLSEENSRYYAQKPADFVEVDEKKYSMQLNLGAIGKGFACDAAYEIIEKYGYQYGFADIGSSSMKMLNDPKNPKWTISLVNPKNPSGQYAEVYMEKSAISTSGTYQRYYEIDGRTYSHIIDASSGYPAADILSSTVICESAAAGDALSTAVCVMGSSASSFISGRNEKYIFVSGSAVTTNMPQSDYKIKDNSFYAVR